MNISSQVSSLPLATVVNPATDSLRRDNALKEVTPPPAATAQSAAEKGLSNKDQSKTAPQNSEQHDFTHLKKQAETANASVNDGKDQQHDSSNQQSEQDNKADHKTDNNDVETQAVEQEIANLKRRDQEVKTHEAAHAAVGGSVTSAPSFSYKRGPDGKNYAVDGEVSVDVSPIAGDPQATIAKMQKVHAAALAPLNPSAQDKRVAAQAAKNIAEAQSEILNGNLEQPQTDNKAQAKVNDSEHLADKADLHSSHHHLANNDDFDTLINKTLKSQEDIAPTRSDEITQRALRIENFYSTINQAYSKEPSFQFQLTA